jgi:16S rRNA (guanine966-N2)-methyltransferase
VRETLFNWLQGWIEGARCLDAFAGTGALGLEAASRGASRVLLIEREAQIALALRQQIDRLGATQCELLQADALVWLAQPAYQQFDLVLLDPHFDRPADLEAACQHLAQFGWLATGARVYLEWPAIYNPPTLPQGWQVLRRQRAGHVAYLLATVGNHPLEEPTHEHP